MLIERLKTILVHSYPDGEIRIVCVIVWPDGLPTESEQDFMYDVYRLNCMRNLFSRKTHNSAPFNLAVGYRYNIIFTVLTYLIPVSVMGVCYSRMSYILWRSQSIGELSQRQAESIQSKRKVSTIRHSNGVLLFRLIHHHLTD